MTVRSTNGNDWVDLIYANANTLSSFLGTKTILKNTFNKCLGKSHLLRFLLLFLVDLKQRGRNTRTKDNLEVWKWVPLWLFYKYLIPPVCLNGALFGGIKQQMFGFTRYLFWQHVFTSPFHVTWCWSHVLYFYSLLGIPDQIQKLQEWQEDSHWHSRRWTRLSLAVSLRKEGTNAVLCPVTTWWKMPLVIFIIFQFLECHPYHIILRLKTCEKFVLISVCFQSKHGNLILLTRM